MNNLTTWGLALAALVVGYQGYGWQGVIFAVTLIVFWLLLQFSRLMRIMTTAAKSPKGTVSDARALNLKLRKGLPLVEILKMTKSLGQRISELPEIFRWTDESGSAVDVVFENGKSASWTFTRKDSEESPLSIGATLRDTADHPAGNAAPPSNPGS